MSETFFASGGGDRLREERERLRLSQAELAERAGVSRRTQINYESDQQTPKQAYLDRLVAQGVDVRYILTGERAGKSDTVSHLKGGKSPTVGDLKNVRSPTVGDLSAEPLDKELLRACIEGVEEGLAAKKARMDAPKKAELIIKLYELHRTASSKPQKATILQFIKRAA